MKQLVFLSNVYSRLENFGASLEMNTSLNYVRLASNDILGIPTILFGRFLSFSARRRSRCVIMFTIKGKAIIS